MKRWTHLSVAIIMAFFLSACATTDDNAVTVRVIETPTIDTVLTVSAVCISAIAVVLSFVTVCLQKKHNRDEVRPILAMHLDAEDVSIKLKNHGEGPAIIKLMKWTNLKNNGEDTTLAKLLVEEWKNCGLSDKIYIHTKPFVNDLDDPDVLAPQEEHCFIDASKYKASMFDKQILLKSFDGIIVELIYTDLYRKKEWVLRKDLSWFAKWV